MCFSAFVVKGVESRQTNVGDFFLRESNCRVRRQSVARRTNGRSGRAARQRQRPSDFRSLRLSDPFASNFACHATWWRLPISPRPQWAIIHQRRPQGSVRTLDKHLRRRRVFQCPLWVNSGRDALKFRCPLYLRKRTFAHAIRMSALGQKQTFDSYSINSSARPDRGNGTVMPSASAVLRFRNSSTFVACWTGRSPGFSPLRTRAA